MTTARQDSHWTGFFDISSVNAVESVFSKSVSKDLWGPEILGRFADIFIYADRASFPLPTLSRDIDHFIANRNTEQRFFAEMNSFGPKFLNAVPFDSKNTDSIDKSRMGHAFEEYCRYFRRVENRRKLKSFADFQSTLEMRNRHSRTFGKRTMVNVGNHISIPSLIEISRQTDMSVEDHLYCFDVVFRYGAYGDVLFSNEDTVGKNSPYFSHPIRKALSIPEMTSGKIPLEGIIAKPPKISFAPTFQRMSSRISMDEYFDAVKTLREEVERYGLRHADSRDIQIESLREMASSANLHKRFKKPSPVVDSVIGIALKSLIGSAVFYSTGKGYISAIIGAAAATSVPVTIIKEAWTHWNPLLPKVVGDKTWLRPITKYDIEDQVEDKNS